MVMAEKRKSIGEYLCSCVANYTLDGYILNFSEDPCIRSKASPRDAGG